MTEGPAAQAMALPAQDFWPQADGTPIDCREKLKVLRENHTELAQVLRDWFDDAVLIGVDPAALRRVLHAMADELADPRITASSDHE